MGATPVAGTVHHVVVHHGGFQRAVLPRELWEALPMPDEVQPAAQPATPVVVVDDTKSKGVLGTNANTALQYGQFGILLSALTVGGPWLYGKLESFHTSAVQSSAGEHKAAREQFTKELSTILQDAKADRKEARDAHEKTSERVWARVGKLSESIEANTKAAAASTVEQHNLVVELRDERRRALPKGANP